MIIINDAVKNDRMFPLVDGEYWHNLKTLKKRIRDKLNIFQWNGGM